jgi:hypothetical protein
MNRKTIAAVCISIVCLAGVAGVLSAQGTASQQASATMDDLVAEIRGLRADLAQSASATIRSQLLVARLQVQEQRINGIARQITETQTELAAMRQATSAMGVRFKEVQEHGASASEEDRRAIEELKRELGPQLEHFQQRIQELAGREGELIQQFSLEQARWSEFNDRLDALERSLPTGLR